MPESILFPATLHLPFDELQRLLREFPSAIITPIRSCRHCETPFPHGEGTKHRSTAVYCSSKCQKADAYQIKTGRKPAHVEPDWDAIEAWQQ